MPIRQNRIVYGPHARATLLMAQLGTRVVARLQQAVTGLHTRGTLVFEVVGVAAPACKHARAQVCAFMHDIRAGQQV